MGSNLYEKKRKNCTKFLIIKDEKRAVPPKRGFRQVDSLNRWGAENVEISRKTKFFGTDNIDSYSREKIYCEGDVILCGGKEDMVA